MYLLLYKKAKMRKSQCGADMTTPTSSSPAQCTRHAVGRPCIVALEPHFAEKVVYMVIAGITLTTPRRMIRYSQSAVARPAVRCALLANVAAKEDIVAPVWCIAVRAVRVVTAIIAIAKTVLMIWCHSQFVAARQEERCVQTASVAASSDFVDPMDLHTVARVVKAATVILKGVLMTCQRMRTEFMTHLLAVSRQEERCVQTASVAASSDFVDPMDLHTVARVVKAATVILKVVIVTCLSVVVRRVERCVRTANAAVSLDSALMDLISVALDAKAGSVITVIPTGVIMRCQRTRAAFMKHLLVVNRLEERCVPMTSVVPKMDGVELERHIAGLAARTAIVLILLAIKK